MHFPYRIVYHGYRSAYIPLGTEELEDELDQPYSEYQEGSIVKVINLE